MSARAVTFALAHAQASSPRMDRAHMIAACAYLAMVPFYTAGEGIAFAALLTISIIRLGDTWPMIRAVSRQPMIIGLLMWFGWCVLALAWSSDVAQGIDELRASRAIIVPFMLMPVMNRIGMLLCAIVIGTLLQHVVQAIDLLGLFGQIAYLNRTGGLLHTSIAGAWFATVLFMCMSTTFNGRGRWRWLAVVMAGIAMGGLLATGSRGVWISILVALPLGFGMRLARRNLPWRTTFSGALVAVIAATTLFFAARPFVSDRYDAAVEEYRAARADGVYWTSVGLRVGFWEWTLDAWREAPVIGHGTGSFADTVATVPAYIEVRDAVADNPKRLDYIERDHPHATLLHILSNQGVIGVVLFAMVLLMAIRHALLDRRDHPAHDAMLAGLLAWIVGSLFDAYHLSGSVMSLLVILMTMVLPCRPIREDGATMRVPEDEPA